MFATLQDYSRSLPFHIYFAKSLPDLAGLCALRAGRHAHEGYTSEMVERLKKIDASDSQGHILVAKDLLTQKIVGALSLHSSVSSRPPVPAMFRFDEIRQESFVFLSRFSVEPGPQADVVSTALLKAMLLTAKKNGVRWAVASSLPAGLGLYARVGFRVLRGNEEGYPLPNFHEERFYGVGERVNGIIEYLLQSPPPLRDFIFTSHAEIRI